MEEIHKKLQNLCSRGIDKSSLCKLLNVTKSDLNKLLWRYGLYEEQIANETLNGRIISLIKDKKSIENIAIELNMNIQMLKNKIFQINQNKMTRKNKTYHVWTNEEIATLKELKSQGKSAKEIAKVVGLTVAAVGKKSSKLKLTRPMKPIVTTGKRSSYSEQDDATIISMRKDGKMYKEIAKAIGRTSGDAIYQHYKKNLLPDNVTFTAPEPTIIDKWEPTVTKEPVKFRNPVKLADTQVITEFNQLEIIKEILVSGRKAVILL